MKQIRTMFLLAACLSTFAALAQQSPLPAQVPPPQGGSGATGPARPMPSVDEQAQMLQERLALDDGQKAKVKTILEDQRAQMQVVMKDESLSKEDHRTKMRSIHETATGKIREILNDDQKKKFDIMQQEMQDRMQQQKQGSKEPPK